ncbi:MAG TPA: type IV toxin-antitoxin system AbiEi family antitoxin domain-containing protein [Actinomycetota bacterium]
MSDRWTGFVSARRVAERQKNLITFSQARECGLSSHQIRGLVRRDEWRRIFRGVFVTATSEPAWQQRALAICLAGGRGVAASHQTAGALLELDGIARVPRVIHVTTTARFQLEAPALRIHETKRPFGIRKVQVVPATTIERTLLDLAGCVGPAITELALEDALRRRLTTHHRLVQQFESAGGKGRPGSKVFSRLVTARADTAPTDSGLETRVWGHLARAQLPGLVKQHPVVRPDGSTARIDLAFPSRMIAIEVESYRWHSGRAAWQRDLARRNDLITIGWTVLHATKEDVDERCRTLIGTIRKLLDLPTLDFGTS